MSRDFFPESYIDCCMRLNMLGRKWRSNPSGTELLVEDTGEVWLFDANGCTIGHESGVIRTL